MHRVIKNSQLYTKKFAILHLIESEVATCYEAYIVNSYSYYQVAKKSFIRLVRLTKRQIHHLADSKFEYDKEKYVMKFINKSGQLEKFMIINFKN